MKLTIYQVDAFTDTLFKGNPAAVCPLPVWLPDETLQNIAKENNLAETAFFVKEGERYHIRWFTPMVEVDLCGHATLASAYVLFFIEKIQATTISFYSMRSGSLPVALDGDFLTLNFPSDIFSPVPLTEDIVAGFDITPIQAYKGKTDYMLVYDNEEQIRQLIPGMPIIAKLKARGVIVTAKGSQVDFVSRFFAPQSGVDEDPVTGSAHTTLIPYWAKELGKNELTAMQLSERTGLLRCKYMGDRVKISGQGKLYMIGSIFLE